MRRALRVIILGPLFGLAALCVLVIFPLVWGLDWLLGKPMGGWWDWYKDGASWTAQTVWYGEKE